MPSALPAKSVTELLGLPPPPQTGRDRLTAAAIELFYRHGFGAVGIDQVIDKAGVTKTTFYKHFESKDDLMVAAIRMRDQWEAIAWARAIKTIAGDDPRRQILATLDVMDAWFNDPEFNGCMFMNAAAEFPNPHDPVHQVAAEHKRNNRNHWRDLAIAAGAAAAAAEAFADCFTAMVEGAFILRQTQKRNDAARVLRPAVEQLLEAYISPVAGKSSSRRKKALAN